MPRCSKPHQIRSHTNLARPWPDLRRRQFTYSPIHLSIGGWTRAVWDKSTAFLCHSWITLTSIIFDTGARIKCKLVDCCMSCANSVESSGLLAVNGCGSPWRAMDLVWASATWFFIVTLLVSTDVGRDTRPWDVPGESVSRWTLR